MEQDIEILEEFIKYYESEAISRKFRGTLSISVDEYDIDAIEHLIKEYKELEEENRTLKNVVSEIFNSEDVTENFIPVSLVEEKIEELEGMFTHELTRNDGFSEYREYALNVLQELLEKR